MWETTKTKYTNQKTKQLQVPSFLRSVRSRPPSFGPQLILPLLSFSRERNLTGKLLSPRKRNREERETQRNGAPPSPSPPPPPPSSFELSLLFYKNLPHLSLSLRFPQIHSYFIQFNSFHSPDHILRGKKLSLSLSPLYSLLYQSTARKEQKASSIDQVSVSPDLSAFDSEFQGRHSIAVKW